MTLNDGNKILFLCDRKACGEVCPNEQCFLTSDVLHAKNFDSVEVKEGLTYYFELEPVDRAE